MTTPNFQQHNQLKTSQVSLKEFAPQYPRNSDGFIVFPSDVARRKSEFPVKVDHPAHNNLYMLEAIAEYLVPNTGLICDPMAGAGSSLILANQEHWLYLIELGEYFATQLQANDLERGGGSVVVIKQGDCIVELPKINHEMASLADLIMFSPPYANQLQSSKGHAIYEEREGGDSTLGIENFTYKHSKNLGNMKEFQFNRAMRQVYQACFKANKPGGYMALIIKDRMKDGIRVGYGVRHVTMALQSGYEVFEWYQREAIGQIWGYFNRNKGIKGVEDEHIIIMRKP